MKKKNTIIISLPYKNNKFDEIIKINIIKNKLEIIIGYKREIIKIEQMEKIFGNKLFHISIFSSIYKKIIVKNIQSKKIGEKKNKGFSSFIVKKSIKACYLIYKYKKQNNKINEMNINIKCKDKNIPIKLLKKLNCTFNRSYLLNNKSKFNFIQIYKNNNNYILLKLKKSINYLDIENLIFIPFLICNKNPEIKFICNKVFKNICYYNKNINNKLYSKIFKFRKLQSVDKDNSITVIAYGTNGQTVQIISNRVTKTDYAYLNNDNENLGSIYMLTLTQDGENKITMKWNTNFNSIQEMFKNCVSLISIDLSNLITSEIRYCRSLFQNCISLKYINLTNFDTLQVTNMNYLFYSCSSLISIDFTNFTVPRNTYLEYMFYGCNSLICLDLSIFNTSKVKLMNHMFWGCSSLTFLNISNFDTSSVFSMEYMFYGCNSLTSLDLSIFDTSKVTLMNHMFWGCNSLTFLNISNFDTSSVFNMEYMFYGCNSLTSLDLSNFNTNNLLNIENMFYNCNSLIYLDISNFHTSKVTNINSAFYNCNNLKYINLLNYKDKEIFESIPNINYNLTYCMNNTNNILYSLLKQNATNNCTNICFQNPIILSINDNKCYYNCRELSEKVCNYEHTEVLEVIPDGFFLNDSIGRTIDKCHPICKKCEQKYDEYNHNCISCIIDYYPKSDDNLINNNLINCYKNPDGYYLDNNTYKQCYYICKNCQGYGNENNHNCTECIANYILINISNKNNCYKKCPNHYYFDNLDNYYCTDLIISSSDKNKDEMINIFNELIKYKEQDEKYLIKGNNYSIYIKPINEYIEESSINIDFSECENILKQNYPNHKFKILQMNIENNNKNCLTDQVEYKIYNELNEEIDLSICKDIDIKIEYEINNKSILNLDLITYFKNKGVDILNINDPFFNDICFPYMDDKSNSDIILSDRVSDIYQNYSFCGSECEYESFNETTLFVNCNCNIKSEISTEIESNFKTYIINTFLFSNFWSH